MFSTQDYKDNRYKNIYHTLKENVFILLLIVGVAVRKLFLYMYVKVQMWF